MKFYNFETMFVSLRDQLRQYLKDNNIYYELSGAGSYYHFEILTDAAGAALVNDLIDSVTITAKVG
jgi:hypothetical protein